jgi:alkaline phosphatase
VNKKTIFILLLLLIAVTAVVYSFFREPVKEALVPGAVSADPSPGSDVSFDIVKPSQRQAKYIFLMIGDGMGEAQRSLAQCYAEYRGEKTPLIMNSLPVSGEVTTYSLNDDVTDSAAAATAFAAGYKTNNGMLSITPDGDTLKTVMEEAEGAGLSTGLVTTTMLTNATPAAFAAHNPDRYANSEIALDFLDSGIDFFAGGGVSYFLPVSYSGGGMDAAGIELASSRKDGNDLVSDFGQAGYLTFVGAKGAADFEDYSPSEGDKVFAAFTNSNMPYETDRTAEDLIAPSLTEMTQTAIETLQTDEDGFVLMVEGGRIDHACHRNDAAGAVYETLSFNDAVEEAYAFYIEHPEETLVIVLADHETGGLKIDSERLDLSHIGDVKLSIQDRLQSYYNGDRDAFFEYLENFGLKDLNPSEKSKINKALDTADNADPAEGYGSVVALAAADIISERTGVSWEGTGHTGVPIPLYAVGYCAEDFSGTIDNTDVGRLLFEIIGKENSNY